jgi:hypothetical protein
LFPEAAESFVQSRQPFKCTQPRKTTGQAA